MRRRLPIGILAIACALLADATPARAAPETWVSPIGTDAGACSFSAPCRTFQFAHGQTNANGVISVISSGHFGPVTITKPISIVGNKSEAGIIGAGRNAAAVTIQAGASDIVSLRGLTIDLRGTDKIGVSFVSGAALHVQNSIIRRSTEGIRFAPASGISELHVADSVIANTSSTGISVHPTGSGGAKVVLDRVRVERALESGIFFSGNDTTGAITGTVSDSVSAGNTNGTGIRALENSEGSINVMVDRTASVHNLFGMRAIGAGATIRIGDSTVSGNATGLSATSGGVIASYGTNKVSSNFINGTPTETIVHK